MVTIGEDADGRIDLARLERGARATRGPAAADRLVLGGVERHRDPLATPAPSRSCSTATARCRSGTSRPPGRTSRSRWTPHRPRAATPSSTTRTRSSSARTSSSAGRARPGVLVARRELFRNRVPDGRRAAARSPTSTRSSTSTSPTRSIARRAGRRPSSSRSGPGSCSSSRSASAARRSARARRPSSTGRSRPGRDEPDIEILGNPALPRLSIVSFTIRHDGRYLHHNFVVALLNDLFGIQSRGGCSCAGPYGHRLLGIDIETSHAFEREISRGCEGIKPGWVRVNFNYFISEAVFDYLVARGRARRPRRLAAAARGTASSRRPGCGGTRPARRSRRCRSTTSPTTVDGLHYPAHRHREPEARLGDLPGRGRADPGRSGRGARRRRPTPEPLEVGTDFESLRWFWLPEEIAAGR